MSATSLVSRLRDLLHRRLHGAPRPDGAASSDQWRRVTTLLSAALERPPEERDAFLERECAGDLALRAELDSLVASAGRAGPLERLADELGLPNAFEEVAASGEGANASGVSSPAGGIAAHEFDRAARELGAPSADGPGDPEGGMIAHYRILRRIGGGGMGVVYEARDTLLDRRVALKLLPWHMGENPAVRERFVREARAAAALDHVNICTIHQVGEAEDGRLFIAMPCYEGETLAARSARGALNVPEAIGVVLQAARGLARAHEMGIVHRDIKPGNIMLTAGGGLKILDFGVAKTADVTLTGGTAAMGTVAYMSPEQARGESVDPRTDVWSLGVVLYEVLAGERPFGGAGVHEVLAAVLHGEPEPLGERRTDLPPEIVRIVGKALARSREERYASAAALLADLEDVADFGAGGERIGADAGGERIGAGAGGERIGADAGGERRQLSVLASAVAGYPALIEQIPPGDLTALLSRMERAARDVVEGYGGMVDRVSGEEIVCLFGMPAAHEDDATRAVHAALELHARIREVESSAGMFAAGAGLRLRLQSGVASGLALVRRLEPTGGGIRESGYGVIGDPIRSATALAIHAEPDEVWIGDATRRRVVPFFETEACPELPVTGPRGHLRPHRVLRTTGYRTRLDAADRGGLTAFTGRDRELAALRRHLERALEGEGHVVHVIGDAGAGKSRLLYEFQHSLPSGRVQVLQGRCQVRGSGVSYLPFVEALRERLHLDEDAPAAARRATAVRTVREIGGDLEGFLPLFLHVLSLPAGDLPLPTHLEKERLRVAMADALATLFTLSSRREPAVMLLEDWHWADAASEEVLSRLAEMAPAYPLLVVVSYRPAYGEERPMALDGAAIHLEPLDFDESVAMIRSVLGAPGVPEDLGRMLHERTGGNPFFLEETCEALREVGAIRVEGGSVSMAGDPGHLELPDSIQAVIRTRLDRLGGDALETLRVAAVIGREFSGPVLEATLRGRGISLPAALERLRGPGLVQRVRVLPDATFRFKHALTQQVAYDSLLHHQRRSLHGRVGRAIEELFADRIAEHVDRLAHHFAGAEEWVEAIRYGRESAEKAASLSQFLEARGLLEEVLERIPHLPDPSECRELRVEVLFRLEQLCEALGMHERQGAIVGELISLLTPAPRERRSTTERPGRPVPEGGDAPPESEPVDERLSEAYLRRGDMHTLLREFDAAEAALAEALRLSRAGGDSERESKIHRSLGLLRWHQRRNGDALVHVEAALHIDRERGDTEAVLVDLSNLANIRKGMGQYERAVRHLEEALEMESTLQRTTSGRVPAKAAFILHNLANVHRVLGDNERAYAYLRQAEESAKEWPYQLPFQRSYHLTAMAHIRLQQGDVEESLRLYRQAVEGTRRARHAEGLSQSLRILGDVLLGLDRPAEALPCLREAAELFGRLRDGETEALLWGRAATAHERVGDSDAAFEAWERARSEWRARGRPRDEMVALEGMARALRAAGTATAAAGYYEEALALARGLGDGDKQGELLNALAILAWESGDFLAALDRYGAALDVYRTLGRRAETAHVLSSLAVTLRSLDRHAEALGRIQEALELQRGEEALGGSDAGEARQRTGYVLAVSGDLYADLGQHAEAMRRYEESLAIRRRIGDRRGEGWMRHALARVTRALDDPAASAAHLRAAEALAADEGTAGSPDAELLRACVRLREEAAEP